jgi:PAS domain S-box-containing protein
MATSVGLTAVWLRHRAAILERARFEEDRARVAHARHLELLSEHANEVVLMVGHDGRIVRANERVRDLHGWSPDEVVGMDVRALRAPGHGDNLGDHIERIRADGHLRYETVHRRQDGTTFPVEVSARGFDADGRWFFQAVVRDVTERKEVLRALSYQAELLRNLHEAVIGLDAQQVVRSWNTAAERIFGLSAAEAIGRRTSEVLPSEYKGFASYQDFIAALDRCGRLNFEVRRLQRNGRWVDVEAAAVVLRGEDGRISGYVSVNRDVTLRKRAEAALRASQERLARILETSSEGIWIVDVRGTTEFVNERAAKLFGATPEVAAGLPYLDFVPAASREDAAADHAAMLRGEPVKREIVLRRADCA